MTPSTRREIYLNAVISGSMLVPTPETRPEMYLAKIAGVDIGTPSPVTREETYLCKIAGGSIIVPTPVTRLETYMAYKCGMSVDLPTPVTREEDLWNKIATGWEEITITSIPPISFKSDGTPLTAWSTSGDMAQTGTPTPDAPIIPQEVGDLVESGEHAGEYAIPITCGGETKMVYLSEPIRKMNKTLPDVLSSNGVVMRYTRQFVLTGTESSNMLKMQSAGLFYYKISPQFLESVGWAISSHYKVNQVPNANMSNHEIKEAQTSSFGSQSGVIVIKHTEYTSIEDYKQYLAEQYAAGTPVTIWYKLETPTTETVTAPTITPAKGGNTLTVGTTLLPSEVSITGNIAEPDTLRAVKIDAVNEGKQINTEEVQKSINDKFETLMKKKESLKPIEGKKEV